MIIKLLKKLKETITLCHIHLFKTLYVNFSLLPFNQAIYLPILIYNKTQIKLSRSKAILHVPPRFGLIKWGFQNDWQVPKYLPSLLMMVNGIWEIKGSCILAPGITLRIHEGNYISGNQTFIGGAKILCNRYITLGDKTIIAFNSVICDTDFHYMWHDEIVRDCCASIEIGNNCWVGNYTTLMKGTKLPHHTTVASKSYVNKDFSSIPEGCILVGTPAKLMKKDYWRLPSKQEGILRQYFKTTKEQYYPLKFKNDE